MELINNLKQSFNDLLDYFTCNLRPNTRYNTYTVIDWTKSQWKYKKPGNKAYYVNVLDEDGDWEQINFYLRRNTTELYVTKEYTLFAVCHQVKYNLLFRYYVLDNSKLIKEVDN